MKSVPEVQVTLSLPLFIAAESEHIVTLTIVPFTTGKLFVDWIPFQLGFRPVQPTIVNVMICSLSIGNGMD